MATLNDEANHTHIIKPQGVLLHHLIIASCGLTLLWYCIDQCCDHRLTQHP